MKKLLAVLVVAGMVFVSCGQNNDENVNEEVVVTEDAIVEENNENSEMTVEAVESEVSSEEAQTEAE